jgi:hypothetical protein
LLFGIILLLFACEGRPKGVLSQRKMTDVLVDIHKLEGILSEKGYLYGSDTEKIKYYNFVYQKYGISQAEFDSSLVWYSKDPKKLEKIYVNVMAELEAFKTDVNNRKYHPVDSAELARRTDNLWNKPTRYVFSKDSARTKLHFEILNDNLLFGDTFVLRFLHRIAPQDSSENQHIVFRVCYRNGLMDSVYQKTYNDSILRRYTIRFPARKKLQIKSITGELLGNTHYKGAFNAFLDSISLVRKYNINLQDSLRKTVHEADSVDYSKTEPIPEPVIPAKATQPRRTITKSQHLVSNDPHGSQFVYCSPEQILRRSVVEQDEHNRISRLFGLDDDHTCRNSHTFFLKVCCPAKIISLKHQLSPESVKQMMIDFHYVDFGSLSSEIISQNNKPFIFDFGTTELSKINAQLSQKLSFLCQLSLFEIIAACTYYPALIAKLPLQLSVGNKTQLILWENVDLVSQRITPQTRIRLNWLSFVHVSKTNRCLFC